MNRSKLNVRQISSRPAERGIAMIIVLLGVAILTVIVAMSLKTSQNSIGLSKAETQRKQATLLALQGIDKARKEIKNRLNQIIFLFPNVTNCKTDTRVLDSDRSLCSKYKDFGVVKIEMADLLNTSLGYDDQNIRLTMVGEGADSEFLPNLTNNTKLPKILKIQNQAASPDGSTRATVTQTISLEKSNAYEYAYILSNQTSDLTIGGPTAFRGQVSILFDNPDLRKIKFDLNNGNVDFFQQLQTNLKSSEGLIIPTAAGHTNFTQGVLFNAGSGISDVLTTQRNRILASPDLVNISGGQPASSAEIQLWVDEGSTCRYQIIERVPE